MNISLEAKTNIFDAKIAVTGSKSETNRALLLQALYLEISLSNISNSNDSLVMQKALQKPISSEVDIHHAGTAMRFLTAYLATQQQDTVVLTGSQRMQERPIKILVEALNQLGANIVYTNTQGMPPLKIQGQKITKNKITLQANISSQYISALILVAPKLENGLTITLEGKITSIPYIKMTLALLHKIGVTASFEGQQIEIHPLPSMADIQELVIESDWSSASYYYSIVCLAEKGAKITLSSYKKDSLQGDSCLVKIYEQLGVETIFNENHTITIIKKSIPTTANLQLDLSNAPDIAQTIVVSCLGLGIACELTGLHTLKIKETDRLLALDTEISKLGGEIQVTQDSLLLSARGTKPINKNIAIATYHDHRMALAFAPLCMRVPLEILEAQEVAKSYPTYWEDLQAFLL